MATYEIEGAQSVLAAVAQAIKPDGITAVEFLAQCMLLAGQDGSVAQITSDGEIFTTATERETNVTVIQTGTQTAAAVRYYGLVDLSDNVNFPHDGTGRVDFSFVRFIADKAGATRGTVSIGVITAVDAVSATIALIGNVLFTLSDANSIDVGYNISPAQIKCGVSGGVLTHIKTPTILAGVTAVNTSAPLAFGYAFVPAVGDLLVRVETTTAGDLTWALGMSYHAH